MTGPDSDPEELNDGFCLGSAEGLDHISLGSETVDELGDASARVFTETGQILDFDSVLVCELAGTPVLMGKEAIRAEGEAHLVPTNVIPWRNVKSLAIPMDDGRLEAADAELIGVNAEDGQ